MNHELLQAPVWGIAVPAAPLILIIAGLLCGPLLRAGSAARLTALAAAAAALLALVASVPALAGVDVRARWDLVAGHGPGVLLDRLSATVFLLVAGLTAVVARFSIAYLDGHPARMRFSRWLCLTAAAVLVLVISDNLLQFVLAWVATSLGLHQLLVLNPDRPGALVPARKKFLISRLGDLCLLGAVGLTWSQFGTLDFAGIFDAVKAMPSGTTGSPGLPVHALAGLLVAGALMKSAQVPFHSWLPETLETPTPVSALMHAGIINAGGFLVLRLHPLISLSEPALTALAIAGTLTAAVASLSMLAQSSVKRALAYSTVAQMGFMMLECGVGAVGLALLHIVAHSLYKAHAFLASGSGVGRPDWSGLRMKGTGGSPWAIPLGIGIAVASVAIAARLTSTDVLASPATQLAAGLWVLTLTYLAIRAWNTERSLSLPAVAAVGTGAVGAVLAAFALHHGADRWLAPVFNWQAPASGLGAVGVLGVLAVLLFALVLQHLASRPVRPRFIQTLGVHARNGFYLGTLATRLVARVRISH